MYTVALMISGLLSLLQVEYRTCQPFPVHTDDSCASPNNISQPCFSKHS